jgi:hypothetical protein
MLVTREGGVKKGRGLETPRPSRGDRRAKLEMNLVTAGGPDWVKYSISLLGAKLLKL